MVTPQRQSRAEAPEAEGTVEERMVPEAEMATPKEEVASLAEEWAPEMPAMAEPEETVPPEPVMIEVAIKTVPLVVVEAKVSTAMMTAIEVFRRQSNCPHSEHRNYQCC